MRRASVWIRGLQEAQRRNLKMIATLQPSSAPGRAVQWVVGEAHRYLTSHTPWETGALRASRRIAYDPSVPRAKVYDDAMARNPRGAYTAAYDATLHKRGERPGRRGGILASYPYTIRRHGPRLVKDGAKMIRDEVKSI